MIKKKFTSIISCLRAAAVCPISSLQWASQNTILAVSPLSSTLSSNLNLAIIWFRIYQVLLKCTNCEYLLRQQTNNLGVETWLYVSQEHLKGSWGIESGLFLEQFEHAS